MSLLRLQRYIGRRKASQAFIFLLIIRNINDNNTDLFVNPVNNATDATIDHKDTSQEH